MANLFVGEYLLNFRQKSIGNCSFSAEIVVNCQFQLIFVISLELSLPPKQNFSKVKEVLIFHLNVTENDFIYSDEVIKTFRFLDKIYNVVYHCQI